MMTMRTKTSGEKARHHSSSGSEYNYSASISASDLALKGTRRTQNSDSSSVVSVKAVER